MVLLSVRLGLQLVAANAADQVSGPRHRTWLSSDGRHRGNVGKRLRQATSRQRKPACPRLWSQFAADDKALWCRSDRELQPQLRRAPDLPRTDAGCENTLPAGTVARPRNARRSRRSPPHRSARPVRAFLLPPSPYHRAATSIAERRPDRRVVKLGLCVLNRGWRRPETLTSSWRTRACWVSNTLFVGELARIDEALRSTRALVPSKPARCRHDRQREGQDHAPAHDVSSQELHEAPTSTPAKTGAAMCRPSMIQPRLRE